MNKFLSAAGSVFLKPVDERRYALVRIAFGLAMFANILDLWFYRELFYSVSIVGRQGAIEIFPGLPFSLFSIFDGPVTVTVVFAMATAASLLVIAGVQARLMLVLVHVFQVSVILRVPTAMSGWDSIIAGWGFILLFSPLACGWGPVRLWRERKTSVDEDGQPAQFAPRYGLVLLQVQVAVIYWETVIQRIVLDDPYWREGSFLTYFLLSHHGRFGGVWPFEWMETLELLTHLTMLVEFSIPILLWIPQMRGYGIIFGVLLHASIALLGINIFLFSFTMLLMYTVFLGGKSDKNPGDPRDP